MNEIYIVIWSDRHQDVKAFPFSTEELAMKFAKETLDENAWEPEDIEEEDISDVSTDNLYFARYSHEGDYVQVVRSRIDEGAA